MSQNLTLEAMKKADLASLKIRQAVFEDQPDDEAIKERLYTLSVNSGEGCKITNGNNQAIAEGQQKRYQEDMKKLT